MVRYIFASHGQMAEGMRQSIEFLTSVKENVYSITAYVSETNLAEEIQKLFDNFEKDDTIVVMTDIMTGSVNQAFYPYLKDNVHIITGVNIPLAMELVLSSEEDFTKENIREIVSEARDAMIYVNDWEFEADEGDE